MPDFTSSGAVREHLVRALEADLVGPFSPSARREVLELPPTRWYLTGFLVPEAARHQDEDPTAREEFAAGNDVPTPESAPQDAPSKRRGRLPASLGITVFVPQGTKDDKVLATVRYADYVRLDKPEHEKGTPETGFQWERVFKEPVSVPVPLNTALLREGIPVVGSGGLVLVGRLTETSGGVHGLPDGTRVLALFLVNRRPVAENKALQDEQAVFQVSLEVFYEPGLLGRADTRGLDSSEWDAQLADLHFRNVLEYAVGHGTSVDAAEPGSSGRVTSVRTTWIPRTRVPLVRTRDVGTAIELRLEAIAALSDGHALRETLRPIASMYSEWISEQRTQALSPSTRKETQDTVLDRAQKACLRIERGTELLASDAQVREAFLLAHRAMAMAMRTRKPKDEPSWRMFQLAFLLLNLEGLANEQHDDRENVELIFFPTGGGKTEAYLGVIAFVLLLRRLRSQGTAQGGLGVTVLLRYTLRLLTLDQLSRAAGVICALELLRQKDPKRLGDERFAIGLWVGRSATANTLDEVSERITEYKNSTSKNAPSPVPLTHCPWCITAPFNKNSLTLYPNAKHPTAVVIGCSDFRCEFNSANNPRGLPVIFVDEQIYRELPSFLVSTVDKFAMLPWRGETGRLFGCVNARHEGQFYGPGDVPPKGAVKLEAGLAPPDLIIQDELHLISGPLGTMVGLYETAIDALSSRPGADGKTRTPKIIASTATVRRASEQVRALFARRTSSVFPPPGIDDSETFFAEVDRQGDGRFYVGVAAPGRSMKAVLLRTYVALLSAGQHAYESTPNPDHADPYMTIAGYFNSLRELGGMRRLVEDEVRTRALEARAPYDLKDGPNPWFANRSIGEPVELTSRERTAAIAEIKARLDLAHREDRHVDVLLASNMISVGVDINRLGLMVVAGQPKTTSEYIQASSRVGRRTPGLVVTVLNLNRSRDRSHFERFQVYHRSFYRFVEASSVTPFSGPALERGLAGLLVALTRHSEPALTPPGAVMNIREHRRVGEHAAALIAKRAAKVRYASREADERIVTMVKTQAHNLLDSWIQIMDHSRQEAAAERRYSPYEKGKCKALLRDALTRDEGGLEEEAKFVAPTSMRDVEPAANLWIERRELVVKEKEDGDGA